MKRWMAMRLRFLADRIHPDTAPRAAGFSFTFERGQGVVFDDQGRRGCPLWYLGHAEYDRAYGEAINPPRRIDWSSLSG